MDFEVVAKPNQMVSFSSMNNDIYVMNQLANYTSEEFVQTAEQLMDDPNGKAAYRTIFEQILKDNMENEYNKTKLVDRTGKLIMNRDKFELNKC